MSPSDDSAEQPAHNNQKPHGSWLSSAAEVVKAALESPEDIDAQRERKEAYDLKLVPVVEAVNALKELNLLEVGESAGVIVGKRGGLQPYVGLKIKIFGQPVLSHKRGRGRNERPYF